MVASETLVGCDRLFHGPTFILLGTCRESPQAYREFSSLMIDSVVSLGKCWRGFNCDAISICILSPDLTYTTDENARFLKRRSSEVVDASEQREGPALPMLQMGLMIAAISTVVFIPLLEEVIFRLFPDMLLRRLYNCRSSNSTAKEERIKNPEHSNGSSSSSSIS
jgi:hypothetical protein